MKVLYLHQYFKPHLTEGATRSYEFAHHLVENGVRVSAITCLTLDREYCVDDDLYVYSTKTGYRHDMSKWRRIAAFIHYAAKAFSRGLTIPDVDIVFATSTPLTIGLPAVLISKLRRKRLLFEVRDVWPDVPIAMGYVSNRLLIRLLKWFEKWIYGNSSHIIVLSQGMYDNLRAKGISQDKMTVIENMSILYLFDEAAKESVAGLEDKFVCIHPGTMGHVNGLDFILDVAAETLGIDDDIVYLLIGNGKMKQHLEQRVKNEQLTNVIIRDTIPKKEVVKAIKASHIGIMCVDSRYKILEDNSANKFFDFLAAGLPVLINYEGWQKEVIEDADCGSSHLTPREMAKEIIRLKGNPEERRRMGENSRRLAETRFSDAIAKQKLLKIIRDISVG